MNVRELILGDTRYRRAHQLQCALAWLSLAAGCTDVLTFLKLGDLFTSAMTGNVALLAIAIGHGQLLTESRSFTALLAFALGVSLATARNASGRAFPDVRGGLRRLLLLEHVFLLGSAVLWSASPDPVGGAALYAVIVLSGVSMGTQAVDARSINFLRVSTVFDNDRPAEDRGRRRW
jgi:uncharacterized membrane protein YoaK (UPF0700 family)